MKSRGVLVAAVLVAGLLMVAGGACYWFFFKKAPRHASDYVPATTLAYAEIPNGAETFLNYQNSKLKKILECDELKGLWAFGLSKVAEKSGAHLNAEEKEKLKEIEAMAMALGKSFSGQSFIALTALRYDGANPAGLIAGFQPKQGTGDFEAFLEKAKALAKENLPESKTGTGEFEKVAYEWIQGPKGPKLCAAKIEDWFITTLGEEALQDFILRYRGKAQGPALSELETFKTLQGKVGSAYDTLLYVNFPLLADQGVALSKEALKNSPPPAEGEDPQMAETRKKLRESQEKMGRQMEQMLGIYRTMKGMMWTATITPEGISDFICIDYPAAGRPDFGKMLEPCAFETLRYTSKDTLFYSAQSFDAPKYYDFMVDLYAKADPDLQAKIKEFESGISAQGFELRKNVLDPLGHEVGYMLDWPEGQMFPDLLFFATVQDAEAFKPALEALKSYVRMMAIFIGEPKVSTEGDMELLSVPVPQVPGLAPTLVSGPKLVGISLAGFRVGSLLKGVEGGNLESQADFQQLAKPRMAGASAVFYSNSTRLLNQAYKGLKPFWPLLAARLQKEGATLPADFKLPESLSFTGDLGSWVMTQKIQGDFAVAESFSPCGNHIAVGCAALVGVFPIMAALAPDELPGTGEPAASPAPEGAAPAPETPQPEPAPPAPEGGMEPAPQAPSEPAPAPSAPPEEEKAPAPAETPGM
jgi:hypothetical protein